MQVWSSDLTQKVLSMVIEKLRSEDPWWPTQPNLRNQGLQNKTRQNKTRQNRVPGGDSRFTSQIQMCEYPWIWYVPTLRCAPDLNMHTLEDVVYVPQSLPIQYKVLHVHELCAEVCPDQYSPRSEHFLVSTSNPFSFNCHPLSTQVPLHTISTSSVDLSIHIDLIMHILLWDPYCILLHNFFLFLSSCIHVPHFLHVNGCFFFFFLSITNIALNLY